MNRPDVVKQRATRKRVAVLSGTDTGFSREVLRGIVAYARRNENWVFYSSRLGGLSHLKQLGEWHGDGVIGYLESTVEARLLQRQPIAMVSVGTRFPPTLPTVMPDEAAVTRLVAEHLIDRGLRHFAYVGRRKHWGSSLRGRHFADALREAPGGQFHGTMEVAEDEREEEVRQRMTAWLIGLPHPIGVLGFTDAFGERLIATANQAGLRVPDDVAVVGVDDDDLMCELTLPPLSSVDVAADRVGYEAAALLSRLMNGEAPPADRINVPPRGMIERQSSDVRMANDAVVAEAARFIRQHAVEGIRVQDVLTAVAVSRRTLERRFEALLGRSLHDEIQQQRLERAKSLLASTQMSLSDISEACAYKQAAHLTQAFRRRVGMTPSEFRRKMRRV